MRILKSILTPLGVLTLSAEDNLLCAVLPGVPATDTGAGAGRIVEEGFELVERQLSEYFLGTRCCFELDTAIRGTGFQQRVWAEVAAIPYGRTCSYKELAVRLGDASKARGVGAALSRNPLNIVVPTHRVVGSRGALTGYTAGLDAKRFLLDHEAAEATASLRRQCQLCPPAEAGRVPA